MKQFGENIWIVEKEFRFAGTDFGNRMTIMRLPSGKLVLHSPIAISDKIIEELNAIGEVAFIVTPNNFHGLFVEEWCSTYPSAKYYSAKEDDSTENINLNERLSSELEESIEIVKINGISKLNEFAFMHKESSTLILTDLAFNFDSNVSLWSKIFFRINGCYEKFGPSKLMKSFIDSSDNFLSSISKIKKLKFSKIIVSHGNTINENAKEVFCSAFSDQLIASGKKKGKSKLKFSSCG